MARALTPTMLRAMRNSHQVYTEIDIVQGGTVVLTTRDSSVRIVDGGISWDVTRDLRCQADVTLLIDARTADLVPTSLTSPFSPVSPSLMRISHGFITDLGPEVVQLGEFDPADVDIEETGGGVMMNITAYDKSRRIKRDRFTDVYEIAAGTDYALAMSRLIERSYPDIEIIASPTSYTTGALAFDIEGDPLKGLYDMADSIGYEVVFGSGGEAIIRPVTEPSEDPQWTMIEGEADTKMLTIKRRLSDEKVYNGVVVRGESFSSASQPVQGEAWDLDPDSPTYYDPNNPSQSSYGPVPLFYVSEFIYSAGQAADAAAARLPKVKGLVERSSLVTRVNPGIELNDVIQVERTRLGLTGPQVVESINYGLKASTMSMTLRERRLI